MKGIQYSRNCDKDTIPTKSTYISPGPCKTTLSTGIGDARKCILLGGARDGSSGRVHEGKSSADQRWAALSNDELSINTLGKPSRDATVLSICIEIKEVSGS